MNFYKILFTNIIYLLSDLFVFLALRHRKYDAFMNKHFEPVLVCCGFFLTVR